jgi:hypothetical protein
MKRDAKTKKKEATTRFHSSHLIALRIPLIRGDDAKDESNGCDDGAIQVEAHFESSCAAKQRCGENPGSHGRD